MEKLKIWWSNLQEFISAIKSDEFLDGYANGVLLALGIIFFFILIKLIFKIIFRKRTVKSVVVKPKDGSGNIVIQVSAIEQAIREEISKMHSISINKVKLFATKSNYILALDCAYDGKAGSLIEIRNSVKARLFVVFKDFFGVQNLKKIDLVFAKASFENFANIQAMKQQVEKVQATEGITLATPEVKSAIETTVEEPNEQI